MVRALHLINLINNNFFFFQKTIKLWKCSEKQEKKVVGLNLNGAVKKGPIKEIKIPQVQAGNTTFQHTPKRVFANAHAYHINSISLNSDGDTFISADDLRVNLWHKEHTRDSLSMFEKFIFEKLFF